MQQIDTMRFGKIEVDETKNIMFGDGLPGLEEYKEYALIQVASSYPIMWLQCVTDGDVALPVIGTFSVVADYAFDIGDDEVQTLELESAEDVFVVSILVIPESLEQMTINLAAPIVINSRTCKAKQIVLNGTDYGVRVPAFAAVCRLLREEDADAGTVPEDK